MSGNKKKKQGQTELADNFWHAFGVEINFFVGVGVVFFVSVDFAFCFDTGVVSAKYEIDRNEKDDSNTNKKINFDTKSVPKIVCSPFKLYFRTWLLNFSFLKPGTAIDTRITCFIFFF